METNENHPVYTTLQDKIALVNKALSDDNLTDTVKQSLLIWRDLLRYVDMVLNTTSFPNIPNNFLNELTDSLSSVNDLVIKHIDSYSSYYSNILNYTKRIPVVTSKGDIKQSFQSLVRHFNNQTSEALDSFKQEQKTTFENWKTQKGSLSKDIQTLQDSKDNLSSLLESLKTDIATQREANQTMVSNLQKDYNTFKKEKDEVFKAQKADLENKITNLNASATQQANTIIAALQKKQEEVEKLWGIIGKAVVSGQAQSYADKAQEMANCLMWIAIGILGGITLGLTIITLVDIYYEKFTFLTFFYKVLASAVLLAPAFYCMNLAKRQRDREFQLRDFEIKTAAFEPFMERMKFTTGDQKGGKDAAKLELTKSFFDKEFAKENKQHGDILLSKDMIQALDKIADIIHKKDNK